MSQDSSKPSPIDLQSLLRSGTWVYPKNPYLQNLSAQNSEELNWLDDPEIPTGEEVQPLENAVSTHGNEFGLREPAEDPTVQEIDDELIPEDEDFNPTLLPKTPTKSNANVLKLGLLVFALGVSIPVLIVPNSRIFKQPSTPSPAPLAITSAPVAPESEAAETNQVDQEEIFKEAVRHAIQAAELTQTAKTPSEWERVAQEWQIALDGMQSISEQSSRYAVAQDRIVTYGRNLQYAQSNAN